MLTGRSTRRGQSTSLAILPEEEGPARQGSEHWLCELPATRHPFSQPRYHRLDMPPPRYDRQALEHERDVEIPAQIAGYLRELDATPIEFTEHCEQLEWQIRRARNRLVTVETRLAAEAR